MGYGQKTNPKISLNIMNTNTVSVVNKFAMDAWQGNPANVGSMAYKIDNLKTIYEGLLSGTINATNGTYYNLIALPVGTFILSFTGYMSLNSYDVILRPESTEDNIADFFSGANTIILKVTTAQTYRIWVNGWSGTIGRIRCNAVKLG